MFQLDERYQPLRQVTHAPHGHILANRQCWTCDGDWLLYDLRHDETIFDGSRIERVNVRTGEVQVLYQSGPHEYCGVPSCSPVDDRFVFIASPRWTGSGDDWQYNAWHRHGMLGWMSNSPQPCVLDARDIVSPYTPGALRGGTHLHMFSPAGDRIASTYEDHVLAETHEPQHEENRRLVVVHYLDRGVKVPKTCTHHQDGCSFTIAVTNATEKPQAQTEQYARAYSEAWLGNQAIVFQGDVTSDDGKQHRELFLTPLPDFTNEFSEEAICGTLTSRPRPPQAVKTKRLTFTDDEIKPGLGGPRHWAVPSSEGALIGCLRVDEHGYAQFWTYEVATERLQPRSSLPFSITSCFTWHPTKPVVAFIADGSVWLLRIDTPRATRLTRKSDQLAPSHHACVFSPDGSQIAFQSPSGGTSLQRYHQLFVVECEF